MRVLVTGATGLVGNNVVRQLIDQKHTVRVLARPNSDPRPLQELPIDVALGDVRDLGSVERALHGMTHVVHSAAHVQVGWTGLELQRAINVEGTQNVADASQRAGVRMVHVSSVDALGVGTPDQPADESTPRTGKTPCPYVITKREAEEVVGKSVSRGLDAVIVNPGFMLGPWDWKPSSGRMLIGVATRFAPLAPTGGCSICDVRDVAEGILAALERGRTGENYILAGYNESYLDLWRRFARTGGKRSPFMRMGPLQRIIGGRGGDLIGRLGGRELDVNSAAIAMSCLFHYYDSSRAQSEFGYNNRPLEDTIHDAWQWFQVHGYV